MKSWLLSGPIHHWRVAVQHGMWGVIEGSHTVKSCWEKLKPGDILYFYATDPVKSFIGVGLAKGTAYQRIPLWPEEKEKGENKYTHRILFDSLIFVDEGSELPTISTKDMKLTLSASMNAMGDEADAEMRKRIQLQWKCILPADNKAALRLIRYRKWKNVGKKFGSIISRFLSINIGS